MQSPHQNQNFVNLSKKTIEKWKLNHSGITLFQAKIRVSPTHFVIDCLWKRGLESDLPQTPSNLISFTIL